MSWKKVFAGIGGILCCGLSLLLLTAAINSAFSIVRGDVWTRAEMVFRVLWLSYFFWLAVRSYRYCAGKSNPIRIAWGRVLIGAFIVYIEVKGHLHPSDEFFKPDNESQAFGMNIAAVTITLLGLALMAWGLWKRPEIDRTALAEANR